MTGLIHPRLLNDLEAFATPPRDVLTEKYYGWKNSEYSDNKTEDERRRTGGIVIGTWVQPDVYTSYNLPPWCYGENWNKECRASFMKNKNEYLE